MMILKVALRDLRRMLKDKCDEIFADEELSRAFYQKIAEIEEDERFVLVEYNTGYWENGHCTCCGEDIASKLNTWTNVQTFSFCPKCGAKMEVKWDE